MIYDRFSIQVLPILRCVRICYNHHFIISTSCCPDGSIYTKISCTAYNDKLLNAMLSEKIGQVCFIE